jgi:uncharacterized membrane protein YeiH
MQITLLLLLDFAGVATFAATGALMAAEKRQDIVTFISLLQSLASAAAPCVTC